MKNYRTFLFIALLGLIHSKGIEAQSRKELSKLTEVWKPIPEIVKPGNENAPPSDAIVLLGKDGLNEWEHIDGSTPKWEFVDGIMTVTANSDSLKTIRKEE